MQKSVSASLAGVIVLAAAASAPAFAQTNDSVYVRWSEDCTELDGEAAGYTDEASLVDCSGYDGWTVHTLSEYPEDRTAVAYSSRDIEGQWREAPPNVGIVHTLGDVMEWRVDGSGRAFATILRSIFTDHCPGYGGQYLTVTALRSDGELGGCHVAYVEAEQQPNPNQIARDVADYLAPDWECGVDAPIVFDLDSEMDVMAVVAQRRPGH